MINKRLRIIYISKTKTEQTDNNKMQSGGAWIKFSPQCILLVCQDDLKNEFDMKMKTQFIKICGLLQKQCLEGNTSLNAYIRKEKDM